MTHWIHSANRRAGQPPRPLGAQHLAPAHRSDSFLPRPSLVPPIFAAPNSQSSGLFDRTRRCGAMEDWRRWRRGRCEIRGTATGILARSRTAKGRAGQADRALHLTQPEAKRNHPFDGWSSQGARPRRGQAGQVHSTLSLPPLGARLCFVVGPDGSMDRHTSRLTAAKYDCPGTTP